MEYQVFECFMFHHYQKYSVFFVCAIKFYARHDSGIHRLMSNTHLRRDETVELRRVGGVNTPVGSRDPVYNFLCWQLTSDDIMTSLLQKNVKIQEYYTTLQIRMFTNMQRHMLRDIKSTLYTQRSLIAYKCRSSFNHSQATWPIHRHSHTRTQYTIKNVLYIII